MFTTDLVDLVATTQGIPKTTARQSVKAVLDAIAELADHPEGLTLRGFGKFEFRSHKARTVHSKLTGQSYDVPAKRTLKFTAGSGMAREE